MPYAQLDDGFYDHPTFANVDDDLVGIWAKGLAYCNKHLTDGKIPKGKALSFPVSAPRETLVDRMVAARLWRDRGDHVEHVGYLDHNPSRAQVRAKLDAAKDRKNKWKQGQTGTLPGMQPEHDPEHVPNGGRTEPLPPSHPIPSLPPSDPERNRSVGREADEAVLQVFAHWSTVLAPLKFKRTPGLTPERRKLIQGRLREFSVAELVRAIDGVRSSPHHCGKNDAGEIYIDFETIFRNRTKVEAHLARADSGGIRSPAAADARDNATQQAQLAGIRARRTASEAT